MEEALAFCAELASGPTATFGRMRANLTYAETSTLAEALLHEARQQRLSSFGDDHLEAVDAFLNKRPAQFTGR
jgi:2-(1,2-epoxy-1,2-dihydrophenyl)acetyl-CoA isomerase